MSEKFRIDLGYDPLFASASFTTMSDASVVVYDKATQAFFYTGSYGGGGGGGNTGSFTGSFTGSISGSISDVALKTSVANTPFNVVFADGTELAIDQPNHFSYNPSLNILIVNSTVSSSNFINKGTVAGTKVTGSFTGSFTGPLTGTSSHAESSSHAISASYAISASHEVIKEVSSSHADTASYVEATNIKHPFTTITASSNISSSATSSGLYGFFRSGSNIGPAEDGTYTDGLFTDFTSNSLIKTLYRALFQKKMN